MVADEGARSGLLTRRGVERLCVYCATSSATTVDHIPPKSLFLSPRPNNLITVPSCVPCNNGLSADDDEFKRLLVLRADVGGRPENARHLDAVHRSLERPQGKAILRKLLSGAKEVNVRTRAGIHLGTAAVFTPDLECAVRVVKRIGRGLYFHETRAVLPPATSTRCYVLSAIEVPEDAREIMTKIIKHTSSRPARTVGGDVFTYWFFPISQPPLAVSCLLRFFGRVDFLWTAVEPPSDSDLP